MHGRKILVTGGTGTIGKQLVSQLVESGHKVALIVRDLETAKANFGESIEYVLFHNNIFDENLQRFQPEVVYHLASLSTSSDKKEDIINLVNSNILFVSLLLDVLKDHNIALFVNAASFSEYHDNDQVLHPTYFYSATKTSARYIIEYFSKTYGFTFVNTVLYSIYGAKAKQKKVIDYLFDSLDSKDPIAMSEGLQILDFVHINDVVDLYLLILKKEKDLQEDYYQFHVGTGAGHTIREVAQLLETLYEKKTNIQWGKVLSRKRDTVKAVANLNALEELLHWRPRITLKEGLLLYGKAVLHG